MSSVLEKSRLRSSASCLPRASVLSTRVQHAVLRDVDARREDQRAARLEAMETGDRPSVQ
jgi:hypothetical protein